MAMDSEDDVLFADLSRQIASLITEDEEEEEERTRQYFTEQYFPVSVQEYARFPQMIMLPNNANELGFTRVSRGTGVFIPKSSSQKRKTKARKPQSTAVNHHTNQFNKKASAICQISGINGCDYRTNHSNYGKSGGAKKLA